MLLQKAKQDLALVLSVGESADVADEIVGFHAQQAVEKALKAVLTRLGVEYRYTHDLSVLYRQVESSDVEPPASLDAVEELTDFWPPSH